MSSKKNILSITLGGKEVPSSNFRLRCYYPYLEEAGFRVTEANTRQVLTPQLPKIPKIQAAVNLLGLRERLIRQNLNKFEAQVREADVLWVNKALHPRLLAVVQKHAKRLILDVDDAIWIGAEEAFQANLAVAETVVAGNEYLKQEIQQRFPGPVLLVPTTVELAEYPAHRKTQAHPFRLGWLGSAFTNEYLLEIAPVLNRFLQTHDAEFHIISGGFSGIKDIFPHKTYFHEWKEEDYIARLHTWDVGLMPMPNSEWVKGKCSFKMLQYMAAGLPVVVSPYGMNGEILAKTPCGFGPESPEEWQSALEQLYQNPQLRADLGHKGRALVEMEFATHPNAEKIQEILLKNRQNP